MMGCAVIKIIHYIRRKKSFFNFIVLVLVSILEVVKVIDMLYCLKTREFPLLPHSQNENKEITPQQLPIFHRL